MERRCKSGQWPPRAATPWPRRPTIPHPADRLPVQAVPFAAADAARLDSPDALVRRTRSPPPSSPLLHPPSLASSFDPLHLIPSSSSSAPDFQLPRLPIPPSPTTPPPLPSPPSCLPPERVVHSTASPPRRSADAPSSPADDTSRRSPPPAASPPRAPAPAAPLAVADAAVGPDPSEAADESEVGRDEFITSDRSPDRAPSLAATVADDDVLWMPRGNMARARRIAYAFVHPDAPTIHYAPYIRAAVRSIASGARFRLFPSSRGTLGLLFESPAMRDYVVDASPIDHEGGHINLERSEAADNRFQIIPPWLALVSVMGFLDEHWSWDGIHAAFAKLGNVVEIDPDCLPANPDDPDSEPLDCSPIRLVIERHSSGRLPCDVYIGNRDHLGTVFNTETLRVRRRENHLDAQGNLRPLFRRQGGNGGNGLQGPGNHHGPLFGLLGPYAGPQRGPFYGPPGGGPAHHNGYEAVDHLLPAAELGSILRAVARWTVFPMGRLSPIILNGVPLRPPAFFPPALPAPAAPDAGGFDDPVLDGLPVDISDLPPPPPPSPAAPARGRGRHPRGPRAPPGAPSRNSARIAMNAPSTFVHSSDKAIQRKALRESLLSCSKALQKEVTSRKILKRKNAVGALDLGRLAKAAGLSCADQRAVAVVEEAHVSA
ncbi:unnamed protein product [Urochloa humidicola]